MIDRYLLRYFLAVVDQGAFSRAATQCRVSQPTLSVGIAKLERLVGARLFNRTNRRVELTPAGVRFAPHARRIETALAAVRASGAPDRIEIVEARQRDLHGLFERGRIDAAIGLVDGDPRAQRTLFTEDYRLALPLDHPLAGRASVDAEAIAAETMIVRRHCEALAETSRHFTARGVRPFMAARTTSDDRALAYVRAGLGVTVMPACYAGEGVAMPRLSGFDLARTIGVLVAGGGARGAASGSVLDLIGDRLMEDAQAGAAG